MKNLKNLGMTFMFSLVIMSCQKEELVSSNDNSTISDSKDSSTKGGLFRLYVMDARFSRATCSTGPGVCFKDGGGNVWDYNFYDRYVGNTEVGPMGISVLNNSTVGLGFYRNLEENEFIIERDVVLNPIFSRALGKTNITLKAGSYAVNRSRIENGEATVTAIIE